MDIASYSILLNILRYLTGQLMARCPLGVIPVSISWTCYMKKFYSIYSKTPQVVYKNYIWFSIPQFAYFIVFIKNSCDFRPFELKEMLATRLTICHRPHDKGLQTLNGFCNNLYLRPYMLIPTVAIHQVIVQLDHNRTLVTVHIRLVIVLFCF